jgi:putative drug exporter of the RND superfamily
MSTGWSAAQPPETGPCFTAPVKSGLTVVAAWLPVLGAFRITVIPKSGPSDAATEDLVRDIRVQATALDRQTGGTIYVTGETAANIDVSAKLPGALLPYLAVVVSLAFVLLALVLRSLLVPLKATLGFLLSIAATFGAVVAVFQWGWLASPLGVDTTGPILSFLPIILVGILFGLAMDYEGFLVTRMREEHVHGASADRSVILGFRHGARVVTAAAIIMISVFAGFILTDEAIIKSLGFALSAGVLIDAFVVRMTLVPAVMSLLGDRAWWLPRWLDRVLPDVDVEGERLTRQLEQAAALEVPPSDVPAPRRDTREDAAGDGQPAHLQLNRFAAARFTSEPRGWPGGRSGR